jgi:hypothetical protein
MIASRRRFIASSVTTPPSADRENFNELRERSLLRHVISSSTEGDPCSVMNAMDEFWSTYFNGEGTAEWKLRGGALDQAIRSKSPTSAMEIGAYCGYTAVRIGRLMPEDGKLVSIEIDPLFAAIATKARTAPHIPFRVRSHDHFAVLRMPALICCAGCGARRALPQGFC